MWVTLLLIMWAFPGKMASPQPKIPPPPPLSYCNPHHCIMQAHFDNRETLSKQIINSQAQEHLYMPKCIHALQNRRVQKRITAHILHIHVSCLRVERFWKHQYLALSTYSIVLPVTFFFFLFITFEFLINVTLCVHSTYHSVHAYIARET